MMTLNSVVSDIQGHAITQLQNQQILAYWDKAANCDTGQWCSAHQRRGSHIHAQCRRHWILGDPSWKGLCKV